MGFMGFNCGANVIAYHKNGKDYAMTCAWATLVDYDKAMMLLGGQSDTGNHIAADDVIGISALSENQTDIAEKLGQDHSEAKNKLDGITVLRDGNAILIPEAKCQMVAHVLEVIHTKENPKDNLVYVEFLKTKQDDNKAFLSFEKM